MHEISRRAYYVQMTDFSMASQKSLDLEPELGSQGRTFNQKEMGV